jgi:hypothetical protein
MLCYAASGAMNVRTVIAAVCSGLTIEGLRDFFAYLGIRCISEKQWHDILHLVEDPTSPCLREKLEKHLETILDDDFEVILQDIRSKIAEGVRNKVSIEELDKLRRLVLVFDGHCKHIFLHTYILMHEHIYNTLHN